MLTKRPWAFIHFACTSEDINNVAYGLMLQDVRAKCLLPQMDHVINEINEHAAKNASLAMLSRTHGQTATPTTLGKELAVFAHRLRRQRDQLAGVKLEVKVNGAGWQLQCPPGELSKG